MSLGKSSLINSLLHYPDLAKTVGSDLGSDPWLFSF